MHHKVIQDMSFLENYVQRDVYPSMGMPWRQHAQIMHQNNTPQLVPEIKYVLL